MRNAEVVEGMQNVSSNDLTASYNLLFLSVGSPADRGSEPHDQFARSVEEVEGGWLDGGTGEGIAHSSTPSEERGDRHREAPGEGFPHRYDSQHGTAVGDQAAVIPGMPGPSSKGKTHKAR